MNWQGLDPIAFQRDGFAHVRSVLSQAEVEELRGVIERWKASALELGHVFAPLAGEVAPVGDLLGREEPLGGLVFDERILHIVRTLLARKDLVYFGDSHVMVGGAGRGFHKDNTNRTDPNHPDWVSHYTLMRMGIYLEDHAHHSGGLKVRRGSHQHVDVSSGEVVAVPSVAGDMVAWNLRTTHSGHAVRIKGVPRLALSPRFEIRIPRALRRSEERERIAIFITWGVDDDHTHRYVDRHSDLTGYPDNYMYKAWLRSCADPKYDAIAAKAGVKIWRPIPDYGSLFGSPERVPEGFISRKSGETDTYELKGADKVLHAIGNLGRSVMRAAS
jgi:hypothetical protein